MKRDTPAVSTRVQRHLQKRGIKPQEGDGQVLAYVNHGRWVADCPCGGAELITENKPLLCGSCGHVREVVWPVKVSQIEQALEDRRRVENQNWQPGEPVELLIVENGVH